MRVLHLLSNCLRLSFLFLFPAICWAQIEIQVLDENRQALPGVNVSLNKKAIASSDLDGRISINPLQEKDTLSFQFLGYEDYFLSGNEIDENPFRIFMNSQDELIEEVIIVGRTNALETDIPFKVESISSKEIKSLQAQTSADVLAKDGSVYVQKSQLGGGSPVIRGFEANKILLVVDGVRLNNAIYRGGHLQNAITIDPKILNRMELIFGPGSLLYGSDALGGVIHFRTKNPLIDSKAFSGSSLLRYSSANKEKAAHVHFSLSNNKNLASLTSISFSDFDDLVTGKNRNEKYPDWGLREVFVSTQNNEDFVIPNDNPNLQVGSSYSQIDVLQKIVYSPSEKLNLSLNAQYSTSSNIPRYDFLTEFRNGTLRYAEWFYGPQDRLLISPRLEWDNDNVLFNKMFLTTAYQKIEEDRISRNLNSESREFQLESLNIFSVSLDFVKNLNNKQTLEYGGSWSHNDLTSIAFSENIITGETNNDILTRYPSGGSQMSQSGAYVLHRWSFLDDKVKWNAGLRYSNQTVSFDYLLSDPFVWPDFYYNGIESNNGSLVWMTGLNIDVDQWQFKLMGGSAFRAPNVDDIAKVRVNADEITTPNPDLIPEKINNLEASALFQSSKLRIGASVFHSWIRDLIVRRDFALPDGSTTFLSGGVLLQVTANVNANRGRIYGSSAEIRYSIMSNLSLNGNINYTKGIAIDNEETESPLDHIPPLYGKLALEYTRKKWNHRLDYIFNGEKPVNLYGGSADNLENATVDGTPSWSLVNLYTSYNLANGIGISGGIENIFDIHYRPFASGVSGAGRNFILSVSYDW